MDHTNGQGGPRNGFRWGITGAALTALVLLTAYGFRQPAPRLQSIRSLQSQAARGAGREGVLESVRVVETRTGGAFVGDAGGWRAVFTGAPEVSPGDVLALAVTLDPGTGEFRINAARSIPRGQTVLRVVILGVSAAVLAVVLANVVRRYRWSWAAGGLTPREEGASWRIS